jgi:Serine dehydrogenase proteinase
VGLPQEVYDFMHLFAQEGRRRPSVQYVPLPVPPNERPAKPRVP